MRKMVVTGRNMMTIALTQSTIVTIIILIAVSALADARRIQESRIINGVDAPRGRFPWIVMYLFDSENKQCGGSLIAPDVVVTAAHCYEETNPDLGYASIGKYNRTDLAEGNPIITVASRYAHPKYGTNADGSYNPNYDIALLKLTQAAINPQLVRLNSNASYPSKAGEELLMLGWGSITNGEDAPLQVSNVLQQATTEYVPFDVCAVASDPVSGVKFGLSVDQTGVGPDWFCTDDPSHNHCEGDSGGPIIRQGDTAAEDLLVAVISADSGGCDNEYLPQINQRVSYQYDWIREVGCQISDEPIPEWGCSGSNTSSTKPTEVPTGKPSVPPSLSFPTSTPTIIPSSLPPSVVNGGVPTLAPSTVTILQPTTERDDDKTKSPVLVTVSTPTSEPTVSAMMGDNATMPTLSPVPTVAPTNSEVTVYIKINFDDSPQEIGWHIADANYSRFRVAVPVGAYVSSMKVANDQVSVKGGESYEFVISDSAGNGLSGGGSYEVYLGEEFNNTVLASGSGDFGTDETTIFYVPGNNARSAPGGTPTAPSPAPSREPISTKSPTSGSLPTRAPSTNTAKTVQSSGCFCYMYIPSLLLAIVVFVATMSYI